MQRIFVYFLVILAIAAAVLVWRGVDGVSGRAVAAAIPASLLFAALVWLRWDIAPKIAKQRRERNRPNAPDRG